MRGLDFKHQMLCHEKKIALNADALIEYLCDKVEDLEKKNDADQNSLKRRHHDLKKECDRLKKKCARLENDCAKTTKMLNSIVDECEEQKRENSTKERELREFTVLRNDMTSVLKCFKTRNKHL